MENDVNKKVANIKKSVLGRLVHSYIYGGDFSYALYCFLSKPQYDLVTVNEFLWSVKYE